jgi:DNA-binding transcriptional LysR family regulator
MELRHLRYFVAVAEEGSLTVAAQKRLHTAQPSLSRQIHDLELELGVQLLIRGPRGIELTAARQGGAAAGRGSWRSGAARGATGKDHVRDRLSDRL